MAGLSTPRAPADRPPAQLCIDRIGAMISSEIGIDSGPEPSFSGEDCVALVRSYIDAVRVDAQRAEPADAVTRAADRLELALELAAIARRAFPDGRGIRAFLAIEELGAEFRAALQLGVP